MLTGAFFYSLIEPLAVRPRLSGALIVIATALAAIGHVFDLGVTGLWKWPVAAVIVGAALAGAAGALWTTAEAKKALFWPLTVSLAAGIGLFAVDQLLTDTGRVNQLPNINILRAEAFGALPLFFWTVILGVLWAWSASLSTKSSGTPSAWFGFWEERPALVWVTLSLITLTAGVIRFWNLGRLGLWSDEGIVYIAALNILKTGLPYLETKLLYLRDLPHLYLTAGAMALFKDVEFSVRLPTVISGILLVPVTFFTARRFFGQKTVALLAAAIIAVHPWMIEYSRFGRSYMMMLLWLYLAVYFFQTGLTSRWSRVGLAAVGLLAAMTHQIGQIAFILVFVALADKNWRAEPRKWWPFLGALAGIVAYKVLFSYGYYFKQDMVGDMTVGEAIYRRIPFSLPRFNNLLVFMRVAPLFLLIGTIAAFARGRWLSLKERPYFYYNAFFMVIMASFLLSKKYISVNRGILFFFPLLALGTALFLLYAVSLVRSRAGRTVIGAVMVVLVLAYGAFDMKTVITRDYGSKVNPNFAPFDGFTFFHDNKTPIEYVNRRWRPGDQVILLSQPTYWVAYSDIRPNLRMWSGNSITYKKKDIYVGIPESDDLDDFDSLLWGQRTWVVTSFSIKWGYRIGHIAPHVVEYLNTYSGQRVYTSKDQAAMVYLIDRRTEKKTRSR